VENITPTTTIAGDIQPDRTEIVASEVFDQEGSISPTNTSSPSSQPTLIPCSGVTTSRNQEGPFYKDGSPERDSLIEAGMPGTPILIIGRVFDQDCNPLSGVKVDFWLANVEGEYDNDGYTLRGHQFTDQNGFYSVESIEPTPYTGRPSHIHVKLFAPNGIELLTTQMYFPGSESSADVLNSPDLLTTYLEPDANGRQQVLFNFILSD
jgi:protocatechuate 3,4-dioxygenase beta subunit